MSIGADKSMLKEIELPATLHLALHELEHCDLAFCLAIRPPHSDCSADGGRIVRDPVGKRFDGGRASPLEPHVRPPQEDRLCRPLGRRDYRRVPGFNADKAQSPASMEKIARVVADKHAQLWLNHDKPSSDARRHAPQFYE
jgi:hypothetical protein